MTNAVNIAQGGSNNVTFRNKIINGAMVIAQRGTSFTPGANAGAFTLDRWEYNAFSTTGAYSVAQSSTVPNGNFTYSSLLTVTATVAPSGTDYYFYQTKIEGYNIADLGWGTADAKAATVSFWARSSVAGTYSFHLINAGINLSYVATFTIASANTWQYVTLTIPGPTTGTWGTTNGVGIYAGIDLGQGSSRQTTANTWSSGASFYCGTSSNVQWINNSGATFYITGVQLEAGTTASPFEYRQYGTELALCMRYYEKTYEIGTVPGTATYLGAAVVGGGSTGSTASFIGGNSQKFTVPKRTAPTVTVYDPAGTSGVCQRWQLGVANINGQNWVTGTPSAIGFDGYSGSGSNTSGVVYHYTASAEL